jgi:TP53 regulating kinase-like protein
LVAREQEARCLVKGRAAGVCTPAVYFVDHATKRLYIEYIEGQAVKHFLFASGIQSPGTARIPGSHATVTHRVVVRDNMLMIVACGCMNTEALELGTKIGQALGRLHNAGVIHGDLTTSNMMVNTDGSVVRARHSRLFASNAHLPLGTHRIVQVMIDFGLSYVSRNHVEDAAVDLYVLERAFLSTHPSSEELVRPSPSPPTTTGSCMRA